MTIIGPDGITILSGEYPECTHQKCVPHYDSSAAHNMSSDEVRKHFPRFFGKCPDCGQNVIVYASAEHYIQGDW